MSQSFSEWIQSPTAEGYVTVDEAITRLDELGSPTLAYAQVLKPNDTLAQAVLKGKDPGAQFKLFEHRWERLSLETAQLAFEVKPECLDDLPLCFNPKDRLPIVRFMLDKAKKAKSGLMRRIAARWFYALQDHGERREALMLLLDCEEGERQLNECIDCLDELNSDNALKLIGKGKYDLVVNNFSRFTDLTPEVFIALIRASRSCIETVLKSGLCPRTSEIARVVIEVVKVRIFATHHIIFFYGLDEDIAQAVYEEDESLLLKEAVRFPCLQGVTAIAT